MALYNKNQRVAFYSVQEVRDMFINYEEFDCRREAFKTDPEIQASILLGQIATMRRINPELRYSFPDFMGLRNKQLDDLEKKCKEAQSQQAQKTKKRSVEDPKEFPPSFVISPPTS